MGVKRELTLQEAQKLFKAFTIQALYPTDDGIIDTTYIASSETSAYILKYYERSIQKRIEEDSTRLNYFYANNLTVSQLLAKQNGWYLYRKLEGETPHHITTKHIVLLARFIAKLHTLTYKKSNLSSSSFLSHYSITDYLHYCKKRFFFYYKKFQFLQTYKQMEDGFIHGDIFTDNTLFNGNKIAVFDFIDGGKGSFLFDCAVSIYAFSPQSRLNYNKKLFLNVYNQHAPVKLTDKALTQEINKAKSFYALLRIHHHQNPYKQRRNQQCI
jgi:homoserine kinase type II